VASSSIVEYHTGKNSFSFGKEKLVAPLIAIPNVDKANRRQEKGKKLN